MTLRQCYEFALIECNKLKAPPILLEDFIYLFNKAIQQYVNSVYNRAEYNQQSSDDIGVLQTVKIIDAENINPKEYLNDRIWTLELPQDYVHILNCVAQFSGIDSKSKCGDGSFKSITSPCHRLTADMYPGIINNYYMKPSHKKPYYYIINHYDNENDPEISRDDEIGYNPEVINGFGKEEEKYDFYALKPDGSRIVNQSAVKIEIHSGSSQWVLDKLYVTYLRAPKYYSMTLNHVLDPIDNSPILEFPDYVCYEIINIYVRLLLENASDPRLQTNIPINQTIAIPGNQ